MGSVPPGHQRWTRIRLASRQGNRESLTIDPVVDHIDGRPNLAPSLPGHLDRHDFDQFKVVFQRGIQAQVIDPPVISISTHVVERHVNGLSKEFGKIDLDMGPLVALAVKPP